MRYDVGVLTMVAFEGACIALELEVKLGAEKGSPLRCVLASVVSGESFGAECRTADGKAAINKRVRSPQILRVLLGHCEQFWYITNRD